MKKILYFFCAMLAFSGNALAADTFSVDNVVLPLNGEADVVVRFNLDAGSDCSGYTFWLQVPEQLGFVTYVKNEKTYVTYTAGDSYDGTPTITPNIDGGYLKVGCLNANSDPLNKQSGILVTFKLKVVGTVSVGDVLTGKLVKGTISAENGSVHDVADATFSITIGDTSDGRILLDETSTTAPTASDGAVNVRVKRTINANEWSTICLPFAMTTNQVKAAFGDGVQLADFTGYDTVEDEGENVVGLTIYFTPVTAIEANHPYVIKVTSGITEFTADNVTIDPEDEPCVEYDNGLTGKKRVVWGTFTGTYVADYVIPYEGDDASLFLSGNKMYYASSQTKHMKAYRACFWFMDILPTSGGASARISMDFDGERTTTGVREVKEVNNDTWYSVNGQKLSAEPIHKGLYINNNKKILVK